MYSLIIPVVLLVAFASGEVIEPTPDHHVTIPEGEVSGKRIFVVGDVHGCYDEMIELFQQADILTTSHSLKNDVILIFTGDIVNKGPKNIQVLRWAQENRAYNVFGNHELNVIEKPEKYDWTDGMNDADREYIRSLAYTVSIPSYDVIVAHAGIMPDRPLTSQTEFIMTRMRNIEVQSDGTWVPHENRKDPGENWATFLWGSYRVIYGHDAGRGKDSAGNPIIQYHPYATGLDSRCVYGGKLSGIFLSLDGQSDVLHQVWCPAYDTRMQSDLQQDE